MSEQPRSGTGQAVGYFYVWQSGDPLPELEPLDEFSVEESDDVDLLASMSGLSETEIARRLNSGHRAYVAWISEDPCAYGWSAWQSAEIGELGISFDLPEQVRYLWDFVTLPAWRGRGIYPRMLQAILRAESSAANRFWIGHDLENTPSRRGILKAGFTTIGEVRLTGSGPVFATWTTDQVTKEAATRLGLRLIDVSQESSDRQQRLR